MASVASVASVVSVASVACVFFSTNRGVGVGVRGGGVRRRAVRMVLGIH